MEDDPEAGSSNFYHMLMNHYGRDVKHTVVLAMSELLNLKVEFNMTVNYYDRMVTIIKKMPPKDEKLVGSFYTSKKMMKELDMGYEKMDACRNDGILFYKKDQLKSSCDVYGQS